MKDRIINIVRINKWAIIFYILSIIFVGVISHINISTSIQDDDSFVVISATEEITGDAVAVFCPHTHSDLNFTLHNRTSGDAFFSIYLAISNSQDSVSIASALPILGILRC